MEQQPLKSASDRPPPYSPVAPITNPPQSQGGWQPPPGYYPREGIYSQGTYLPSYGATAPVSTTVIVPEIILVGACPACRVGMLEDDYTCLGLFCAIFFFPLGILCCLALKNRRCSNCGAYFG
ncbi:brain protein I3 [Athalia rosae]|uniref:brain protein I3 n=1 Tax=Athalia rosae TaxID=37344 RepID=UPI00062500AA|nr:brain protein I3 [Athalia rosae]